MLHEEYSDLLYDKSELEVNRFLDGISQSQTGIFNRILALTKELELDPKGNIKSNTKNLAILKRVRSELQKVVLNDAYYKKVNRFTSQFESIKKLNDNYFTALESSFNANKFAYKDALASSIQITNDSLLDSGINANVIDPAKKVITDAITGKWSYADLVDNLRTQLKGNEETLGSLERYASQIATDSLNQFSANYTQTVSEDLGFEWYYYSGGKRKTSRPFCKEYANKYFHREEVMNFGRGKDLDGHNLSSELMKGRIRGTNASNIFTYRGGYHCYHSYVPVGLSSVPQYVVNRNIDKGYFEI